MKRRSRKAAPLYSMLSLPWLMTSLTMASWETIMRRTLLISQNKCSAAEYRRMVREKAKAATETGARLFSSRASLNSLLAPWLSGATANAKRLRKKKK